MQTPINSRANVSRSSSSSESALGGAADTRRCFAWPFVLPVVFATAPPASISTLGLNGRQTDPDALTGFAPPRSTGLDGQLLLHRRQKVTRTASDEVANEGDSGYIDFNRWHRFAEQPRFRLAQIMSQRLEQLSGAIAQLADIAGIDAVHPKRAVAYPHAMFRQHLHQTCAA